MVSADRSNKTRNGSAQKRSLRRANYEKPILKALHEKQKSANQNSCNLMLTAGKDSMRYQRVNLSFIFLYFDLYIFHVTWL